MPAFPDAKIMQEIAAENALSETAFLVGEAGEYRIRWFTPEVEVPLCGHATLASAAVVMERLEPDLRQLTFHSASGPLGVTRRGSEFVLGFPARPSARIPVAQELSDALGCLALELFVNEFNYMAVMENAAAVKTMKPDMSRIMKIDRPGVIVTAPGDDGFDIVSRYFAPRKGIPEDPVTGAAHCMIAPFWSARTGRDTFRAYQASARGGEMTCRLVANRVELQGACTFYMEGVVQL
jgi:PhzF family phenazine biosynthesis protein